VTLTVARASHHRTRAHGTEGFTYFLSAAMTASAQAMASTATPELLYRLALAADIPEDAWRTRLQWTGAFGGCDDVCMFTADQLASGAGAAFIAAHSESDIKLLCFATDLIREEADLKLRWKQDGSSGTSLPHVEGPVPYACLAKPPKLLAREGSTHVLPALGAAAAETADSVLGKDKIDEDTAMRYVSSDDDNGNYDGCAATGMYG